MQPGDEIKIVVDGVGELVKRHRRGGVTGDFHRHFQRRFADALLKTANQKQAFLKQRLFFLCKCLSS